MSTHLLASTVLMAVLILALFVTARRLRTSTPPAPTGGEKPVSSGERLASRLDSPAGQGAMFVALAFAAGALAVASVGGMDGLAALVPNVFVLLIVFLGLMLTGFLFLGSYVTVRQHGFGTAQGLVAGLFVTGIVFVLLVTADLAFGFT
jgi:hypothetical protein